jgi:hypothetical protein
MASVLGTWLVEADDIPQAASLALRLAGWLPGLSEEHLVEVVRLSDRGALQASASSPSGRVRRYAAEGLVLDVDWLERFWRIYLFPEFLGASPLQGPDSVVVAARQDPHLGPLLAEQPAFFVGGLVSLSAEPPEGFFAASTSAELRQSGHRLACAEEADVWLMRVPDARTESFFQFHYGNPQRPKDSSRQGKFLVASGVGPASEPTSPGGAEADTLWLGDEQHGPWLDYLRMLQRPDLRLSHFTQCQGVIQKLPGGRVVLCQPHLCWGLSREGFEALVTEPELYRQVYSHEYDAYLRGLFRECAPAKASYLLATSRGCTQGCSLCCSGGLKAFQAFSAARIVRELEAIAVHADLQAGELADVFFLDSNFNNAPDRIIELADRLEQSPLNGRFRFFVRHNTVKGFLKGGEPNLELIDAFRRLGIADVFMGVDTFDDHSTLTLKSNRLAMVAKGTSMRPTYTSQELARLIQALQASGAHIRAFYLQNNPWVSDLDRLDSYYNLAELWLRNPNFSIDARYRDVNRLKPFAGSPIERVTRHQPELVRDGRYLSAGVLGELDESMHVEVFGRPRVESSALEAMDIFWRDLEHIRRAAGGRYHRLGCAQSRRILVKMRQREQRLRALILGEPGLEWLLQAIDRTERRWLSLPDLAPGEQQQLFEEAAAGLFEGLRQHLPRRARPVSSLYPVAARPAPVQLHGYRSSRPVAPARPLEMRCG